MRIIDRIDSSVFSRLADEVESAISDGEDTIWFAFMDVDGIYDDALLIPHIFHDGTLLVNNMFPE
jgi:hypothetical protein